MESTSTHRSVHFETMLWQNELEYHRRELAIFESYLLNIGGRIRPYQLTQLMGQLHQFMQSVNKLLAEIRSAEAEVLPLPAHPRSKGKENEVPRHYIREEIFYFGKSYRQFKHTFCSFTESLEVA